MTLSLRFRPVFAVLAFLAAATPAAAQSISMTADRSSAIEGQTVRLHAVVTQSGVPVTQGHIYFTGSGGVSDVLGFLAPDATGSATFSTNSLAIGRHEIVARYKPINTTQLNNSQPKSTIAAITIVRNIPFGALTMPMPATNPEPCAGVPALADFNNDGLLDHAAACAHEPAIHVRMGNGDGTFQPATVYATSAHQQWDLVAADFDDDGRKDIVVLGTTAGSQPTLTYFDNSGNGAFAAPVVSNFSGFIFYGGRLNLMNADGTRIPDVVISSTNGVAVANIGTGRIFTQRFALPYLGEVTAVAAGDINGDGFDDLAVTLVNDVDWVHKLFVYKANATAFGFTLTTNGFPLPIGEQMVNGLVIEDVTGNGRGDVVSSHGRMWPGLADGSVGAALAIPSLNGSAIVAGEFTGDTALDVLATGLLLPGQLLAPGQLGGFFASAALPVPIDQRVAVGDIDNDGRLDAAYDWAVMLARNATSMTMTIEGTPAPGDPFTIRATVAGATDGSVTFGSQFGTLGTASVDENGVAILTPWAWAPIGLKTVTASFSGNATYGRATASATFTIVKAPSEMFLYISPETPGHNQPFTVQAGVITHGPSVANGGNMVVTIDNQAPVQYPGRAFVDLNPALPGGTHTITVSYTGDSVYLPGTITRTFAVGQASTQTTITSNAWSIQFGAQFQLTASVTTGGTSAPTGSVTFMDGDQVMGTVPVDGTLPAFWTTSPQTPGVHHYRAIYQPNNASYLASESSSIGVSVMLPGGGLRRAVNTATAGASGPPTTGADNLVRLGDLNHDGKLDVVVAQRAVVSVFLGKGDLTFEPRIDIALPASAIGMELLDNNGDGHFDVFVAMFSAVETPIATRVLYGSGTGQLLHYVESQLPGGAYDLPGATASGNFTGDWRPDRVVADGRTLKMFSDAGALLGTTLLNIWPSSLTLADLNHDGRADLLASEGRGQTQLVMLADGIGGFSAPVWTGSSPSDPALYDFDTDGHLDLIAVDGHATVFRGNGDGTFQAGVMIGPAPGASPAIGDLNNDATLDLVTVGDALHAMAGAAPVSMTVASDRDYLVDPQQPITVTVTVAARNTADGVPVGPIRFHATSVSAEAQSERHEDVTPVNGVATFTNVYPSGWLDITVDFDGDATFGAASSLVSHFVLAPPPPPVNTPPSLGVPADIVVDSTDAAGTSVSFTVTVTDAQDSGLVATCSPASGSIFAVGTTSVACSVTDNDGASASGSFNVTVTYTAPPPVNTPPTLSMPGPIVVEAERAAGTVVTYVVTAIDAEDGALVPVCRPLSGKRFPLGTTVVSCTAKDSKGLVATGAFTITVVDTTAPTVTFKANKDPYDAHQNVNIRCVAKDPVSGIASSTCVDIVGPAYSFALGLNTFTATATDGAGNSTTETTSFTVEVTIASLKNLVRDFSTNDVVTKELIQKLNKNQLAAFRTQVQAQSGLAFTTEQAALLLRLSTGL